MSRVWNAMVARIVELARLREAGQRSPSSAPIVRLAAPAEPSTLAAAPFERIQFWAGASGRRYVHTVYSLVECPPHAHVAYLLVRRDADGRRTALRIDRSRHKAASLNLADVRRRGAELGANEVHLHLVAESASERDLIVMDLRASQFGALSAEAHVVRPDPEAATARRI